MDPVEESRANLALTERLRAVAASLRGDANLTAAMARQDAAASTRLIARALYGA
jgi:xylose isomerase